MGQDKNVRRPDLYQEPEKPCWREILVTAMAGIYPTDQQLERMIDHLERMP